MKASPPPSDGTSGFFLPASSYGINSLILLRIASIVARVRGEVYLGGMMRNCFACPVSAGPSCSVEPASTANAPLRLIRRWPTLLYLRALPERAPLMAASFKTITPFTKTYFTP